MLYHTQNPHGGDLYGASVDLDFSANTNPLGTPPAVRRAAAEAVKEICQYPDPYCRKLVAAIAVFEHVPRDFVLCGGGAAELIFSYCGAKKPRRALAPAPTFSEYAAALTQAGCQVERHILLPGKDFALGEDYLAALEGGDWDVAFLCNPNNPTGQLISTKTLQTTLEICRRKSIGLFVDECFLDLSDGWNTASLKEMLVYYPELFILKAFTKSYGMAGLRLGYGLCSDSALLEAMARTVQPWNVSTPAQAAGVAALEEQEFLRRTRRLIQTERAFLTRELTSLGLRVYPSQANFLLLYSDSPLEKRLKNQRIQIRSCQGDVGLGQGWYRTAVKRRKENQRLLAALASEKQEGALW